MLVCACVCLCVLASGKVYAGTSKTTQGWVLDEKDGGDGGKDGRSASGGALGETKGEDRDDGFVPVQVDTTADTFSCSSCMELIQ